LVKLRKKRHVTREEKSLFCRGIRCRKRISLSLNKNKIGGRSSVKSRGVHISYVTRMWADEKDSSDFLQKRGADLFEREGKIDCNLYLAPKSAERGNPTKKEGVYLRRAGGESSLNWRGVRVLRIRLSNSVLGEARLQVLKGRTTGKLPEK